MNPSHSQRLRLRSRTSPAGTIITISGDLDIATAPELRERLLITLGRSRGPVVFDLSGITFCDAAGLSALIGARRRAMLLGMPTSFAAPSPQLYRLLRITGLHRTFVIHPTPQAAIRPVHAGAA